jgi:hypothetical protein
LGSCADRRFRRSTHRQARTRPQGQESGRIRPGSAEQQALVAFAAVHGVATLATDDLLNGVPWQDAASATISFVWSGLSA